MAGFEHEDNILDTSFISFTWCDMFFQRFLDQFYTFKFFSANLEIFNTCNYDEFKY